MTYVTGAHSFKLGTNLSKSSPRWMYDSKPLDYLFYYGTDWRHLAGANPPEDFLLAACRSSTLLRTSVTILIELP